MFGRGPGFGAKHYNEVRKLAKEQRTGKRVVMRYFMQLKNDDACVRFCVENGHIDPTMKVLTPGPDGDQHEWRRVEGDGITYFYPPESYVGGPVAWVHDKNLTVDAKVFESSKLISLPSSPN